MRIVTVTGKYAGEYPVFDGLEEAIRNGVAFEEIGFHEQFRGPCESYPKHLLYSDGVVSEVLEVNTYKMKTGFYTGTVTTPLNRVNPWSAKVLSSTPKWGKEKSRDRVTKNRFRFAQSWLFEGMAIEVAASKFLKTDFYTLSPTLSQARMRGTATLDDRRYTLVRFAYLALSEPWFDKLLAENRVFRDKYMSLVHAFDQAGLTDAYIAEYIKKKVEATGVDKATVMERMSAFNKAVEIRMAAEARTPKSKELGGDLARFVDNPEQKAIPEKSSASEELPLPESFTDIITPGVQDASKEGITEANEGHESIRPSISGSGNIQAEGEARVSPVSPYE